MSVNYALFQKQPRQWYCFLSNSSVAQVDRASDATPRARRRHARLLAAAAASAVLLDRRRRARRPARWRQLSARGSQSRAQRLLYMYLASTLTHIKRQRLLTDAEG